MAVPRSPMPVFAEENLDSSRLGLDLSELGLDSSYFDPDLG
jgi:hypothetical protein